MDEICIEGRMLVPNIYKSKLFDRQPTIVEQSPQWKPYAGDIRRRDMEQSKRDGDWESISSSWSQMRRCAPVAQQVFNKNSCWGRVWVWVGC